MEMSSDQDALYEADGNAVTGGNNVHLRSYSDTSIQLAWQQGAACAGKWSKVAHRNGHSTCFTGKNYSVTKTEF